LKTIVVTGPESTGKTMISAYLAGQLNCPWIPEYARDYIGSLDRHYNYSDLIHIAETQVNRKKEIENSGASFLVLDTWLIITKVWFQEVFNKYPIWIDNEIKTHKIDLFLVCKPDIPWIPDPLRENGGEKREYLMNRYIEEIQKSGTKYILIGGTGDERYKNAFNSVKTYFNLPL
jgi:NadR type nicotinamide-nucleotide adenylyltransferase